MLSALTLHWKGGGWAIACHAEKVFAITEVIHSASIVALSIMSINELHSSHIGRVEVDFYVSSPSLNPSEVTAALGIQPDEFASRGDERRNYVDGLLSPYEEGFWLLSSKDKVQGELKSKDIDEHFMFLLKLLLPHHESILRFAEGGETYFGVLWESSYLYAGTGPVISCECIAGIAQLGAYIGFDIYQIEVKEVEE